MSIEKTIAQLLEQAKDLSPENKLAPEAEDADHAEKEESSGDALRDIENQSLTQLLNPDAARNDSRNYEKQSKATQKTPSNVARDNATESEPMHKLDFEVKLQEALEEEGNLSEEFITKAGLLFEAAVVERVKNEVEKIQTQVDEMVAERVEKRVDNLVEQIDAYLTFMVEQWVKENEVAIEKGIKGDILESLVSGMQELLSEHSIEVKDSEKSVQEKIASLKEENEALRNRVSVYESAEIGLKKEKIFDMYTKGLSEAQIEKVKSIVEDTNFKSEEDFEFKVKTLTELYKSTKAVGNKTKSLISEKVSTSTNVQEQLNDSPEMEAYVQAIKMLAK